MIHPIADCEHPLLCLLGPGLVSQETAISGSFQQNLASVCNGVSVWKLIMGKKDTCSTMFIAALFIISRSWKEPRCPSTEEWIQKMWYIYTFGYKNNHFMKFVGKWMDVAHF